MSHFPGFLGDPPTAGFKDVEKIRETPHNHVLLLLQWPTGGNSSNQADGSERGEIRSEGGASLCLRLEFEPQKTGGGGGDGRTVTACFGLEAEAL